MSTTSDAKLNAHIDFLKKNIPTLPTIFMRRMQCLSDFVSCFDSKLKELNIIHLFPEHVQWFSYWISNQGREDIEQHFKRNKTTRQVNSLLFEFVRPLIATGRGHFDFMDGDGNQQRAFFRYNEEDGTYDQETFFIPKIDKTATYYSAAAVTSDRVTKNGNSWLAEIWLVGKVVTRFHNRQLQPLIKGDNITFDDGYLPDEHKPGQFGIRYFEGKKEKVIFGVNLEEYKPYLEELVISLKKYNYTYKPDAVELMNILIVLILFEHELVHIWIALLDQDESETAVPNRLARPDAFDRIYRGDDTKIDPVPIFNQDGSPDNEWNHVSHAKTNEDRIKNNEWPALDKEEERCLASLSQDDKINGTRFAYTDTSGHQYKFCQLTHLMFGHVGQTTCASKFVKPGRPRNKK
jgi:hypothetical protein